MQALDRGTPKLRLKQDRDRGIQDPMEAAQGYNRIYLLLHIQCHIIFLT